MSASAPQRASFGTRHVRSSLRPKRVDRPLIIDEAVLAAMPRRHRDRVWRIARRALHVLERSKRAADDRARLDEALYIALHWALEELGVLVVEDAPLPKRFRITAKRGVGAYRCSSPEDTCDEATS